WLFAAQLFGGKVRQRPHDSTRRGQVGLERRGGMAVTEDIGDCHDSRQAKIENFRLAPIRHEDISWLDIPMPASLLMSSLSSVCCLNRQLEQSSRGERSTGYVGRECLAIQ